MSAKATFWAWEQSAIKGSSKFVLLCLADCHNADTERCDPSAEFVAKKTGLNIKTVGASLLKIEESGLISIKKNKGKNSQFTLNMGVIFTCQNAANHPQNRGNPKLGIPENGLPQNRQGTTPKIGVTPPPKLGDEPISNLKYNLNNNNGTQNPPTNHSEIVPHETKKYFFEREVIKLNETDYKKFLSAYPVIADNLNYHLEQLDLELRGKKKWFVELTQKLRYLNQYTGGKNSAANRQNASSSSESDLFTDRHRAAIQRRLSRKNSGQ